MIPSASSFNPQLGLDYGPQDEDVFAMNHTQAPSVSRVSSKAHQKPKLALPLPSRSHELEAGPAVDGVGRVRSHRR